MLITILVVLLVLALVVWLVNIAPTPAGFPTATVKWIVLAIATVVAIVVILRAAGISLP